MNLVQTIMLVTGMVVSVTSYANGGFRVESRISVEDKLVDQRVILFDNGVYYDLPDSRFATVIDPAAGQISLLDRQTQVLCRLTTDELVEFVAQFRAAAAQQNRRDQMGMTAQVKVNPAPNTYEISFDRYTYVTKSVSPSIPGVAQAYGEFSFWVSRLNLVRQLGPPPFGRMALSQHIAKLGGFPAETTLTIRDPQRGQQQIHAVSELVDGLRDTDEQRIRQIRGAMSLYRQVSIQDFPTL